MTNECSKMFDKIKKLYQSKLYQKTSISENEIYKSSLNLEDKQMLKGLEAYCRDNDLHKFFCSILAELPLS